MRLFQICFCLLTIYGVHAVICARKVRQRNAVDCAPTENDLSNTQKVVAIGIMRIAITLNALLSKFSEKDANIVLAPINIVKTLATVMLGTAGDTEKQLRKILGLILGRKLDSRIEALHREIGILLTKVTDESPGVEFGTNLNIAGGVFIQKDFEVNSNYIELAKSIYRSDVITLDFAGDGMNSAIIINEWISNHTNNRIKKIVQPPIDPMTRLIIAGALYFNGDWEYPFIIKATKWQPFYLGSEGKFAKESVQVQMMVNEANIPYYEDKTLGFQAIGIPYKNHSVYMYVVVPRLNLSLKNLTQCFSYKDVENIVHNSKNQEVFYVIPKMKLENMFNLRGSLEKIGVKDLFSPAKANFSNLAEGVYVDEILHKVEMDVNEIGTTATAATLVSMNRGGYINFRADRPFFFFIYNVKVDVMTFWGSIQKPLPFK